MIVHKVTRKINWWNICWKPSKLFFISIKFRCLFEACSLESVFKIWISDWAFKTNILVLVLAPMQYWVLIIKEISIFMYFLLNLLIKRTENFFFQKIKCFKNQVIKINENINFSRYKNQMDSKFRTISDFILLLGKRLAGQKNNLCTFFIWPQNCQVQILWEGHKIWKNLPPVLTKQFFFTQ